MRGLLWVLGVVLAAPVHGRELSFAERVRAREAIERVYYSYQDGATARFEDAVPRRLIEARVRDELRKSAALEAYWKTPITASALRNEMERIARDTRFPGRLIAIYDALGNDPVLIQESLARATLADRWTRSHFEFDPRAHAPARREAEDLQRRLASGALRLDRAHTRRRIVEREIARGSVPDRIGEIGPVDEERDAFVIRAVVARDASKARVATYVVPKRSWDSWWAEVAPGFSENEVEAVADGDELPSPLAAGGSCKPGDSWDNGSLGAVPEGRSGATAVWTGRVMIVWGGSRDGRALQSGGRYDPLTDVWAPTSIVGAPVARWDPTATWTGSRMIVWGGALPTGGFTATGASYDPIADTWTPISTMGAPQARQDHTAVWTGTRLVVWGGSYSDISGSHYLDDGGGYDPATDTWSPVTSAGAPLGRRNHTAIWTGSTMVVWGGDRSDGVTTALGTGGRYDPETNTWLPVATAGAPSARTYHRAAWTGTFMAIWGGQFWPVPGQRQYLGTGARYDPASDTWSPMSTVGAPVPRIGHAMAAAEGLIVVWGGQGASGMYGGGSRYDAQSDTWTPISPLGAPSPRSNPAVIWTGSTLVVWSGGGSGGVSPDSGGRYNVAADKWTPTFSQNAPLPRVHASAVWTGNEMIVWGGLHGEEPLATGGRYDPLTDSWTATSVSPLNRIRVFHTAVWTGSRMIVWGGEPCPNVYDKGTSYDPVSDTWTELDYLAEPAPRRHHTAVWTGSRMLVWGGLLCSAPPAVTASGSAYDPGANAWSPLPSSGVPSARQNHTAIWTGSSMVVWGGSDESLPPTVYNTGGRYDPFAVAWSATRKPGAPAARTEHTAVWTGSSMVVWGGTSGVDLNTGGRYDPVADTWAATSTTNAPVARLGHSAVWAEGLMVVWGGDTSATGTADAFDTGGRYDPVTDAWTPTSTAGAPWGRTGQAAVWTGTFVVVWGGVNTFEPDSGGRYVVQNPDLDLDGVADACDCAPGNPGVTAIPPEVSGVTFGADKVTISWSTAAAGGGSSTVHDGIVGALGDFPVSGNPGIACMGPGTSATSVVDGSVPPVGAGRWYLVRGRNVCGTGTYGAATGGGERTSSVCP